MSPISRDEQWNAEIDKMLRSMRRIGIFMMPVMLIAALMLARIGMWVNSVLLSGACGYIGFSVGVITGRLRGRADDRNDR